MATGISISAPVSISKIQGAFGVTAGDTETLMKTIVNSTNGINIWSKYKPIYHSKITPLTDSERQNSGHIVAGYVISWGIMKPSSASWYDYIDVSTGVVKSGMWGYDKPTGTAASPWRLTDFDGYNHDAVCPINFSLPSEDVLRIPSSSLSPSQVIAIIFTFQNGIIGWNRSHSLTLAEAFASEISQNYYPTVIMTCFSGGRVWEYAKSGDHPIGYYTGNVNPYVNVLVDTDDVAKAAINDGTGYNTDPLANGAVWTVCMALVSQRIEGGVTTHTINNCYIRRLEYAQGVDRKNMTVDVATSTDEIESMSVTLVLKRNTDRPAYYYIDSVSVTIKMTSGGYQGFAVNASFTCLVGTVGGTGWNEAQNVNVQYWSSLSLDTSERGHVVTKLLNFNSAEFRFTDDIYTGQRVAGIGLSFDMKDAALSASFGFNVAGGAASYSQTVTIK